MIFEFSAILEIIHFFRRVRGPIDYGTIASRCELPLAVTHLQPSEQVKQVPRASSCSLLSVLSRSHESRFPSIGEVVATSTVVEEKNTLEHSTFSIFVTFLVFDARAAVHMMSH